MVVLTDDLGQSCVWRKKPPGNSEGKEFENLSAILSVQKCFEGEDVIWEVELEKVLRGTYFGGTL